VRQTSFKVAVLIPCLNEERTVFKVVRSFQEKLPSAEIYVGDNGSIDDTRDEAIRAGARVISESRKGKGAMIRRMFAEIEADCYLMVDGDGTYAVDDSPRLIDQIMSGESDMVIAVRLEDEKDRGSAYRSGHKFGSSSPSERATVCKHFREIILLKNSEGATREYARAKFR
jgi:glycosyltransferase involved in cell wall biosynthesis